MGVVQNSPKHQNIVVVINGSSKLSKNTKRRW